MPTPNFKLPLPTIPKRVLDFNTLATGSTQDLILADRIPVLNWDGVNLQIQVHSHTLASGAGTIKIIVANQSWTAEDPGLEFVNFVVPQVTLDSSTSNPGFVEARVGVLSEMVRVLARGNRTSVGALSATISGEFLLNAWI